MNLRIVPGSFALARLDAAETVPSWVSGSLVSVTRTPRELSITCDQSAVPSNVVCERGWRALEVEGPIAFDVVGVAASISGALAAAGIPLILIGTFDTDIVLVKENVLEEAIIALRAAGHVVIASSA